MYLLISFWLPQCNLSIYLKHGTYQYVLPHTDIYWHIQPGTVMYRHVLQSTGLYSSRYQIPYFSHFSVQDGAWTEPASIRILYTWMDEYKGFILPCTCLFRCTGCWYCPGSVLYWKMTKIRYLVLRRVQASTQQYMTVHDSTRWYVSVCGSTYWYVPCFK